MGVLPGHPRVLPILQLHGHGLSVMEELRAHAIFNNLKSTFMAVLQVLLDCHYIEKPTW